MFVDDDAFALQEMPVTHGSLERAHEELGEQASRHVLADHQRLRTALAILYLYPDFDAESDDAESDSE